MRIEKRTMGWIQKPSAFQYAQQQAAKRRAHAQDYLSQQSALSGAIFSAKDNASSEFTALILKSVVNRISKEAQAKVDKALPANLLSDLKSKIDSKA